MLDEARGVRAGEGLDGEALRPFLEPVTGAAGGEIRISQFPSGFSNLTYLVQIGSTELVLRRPPFGVKIQSAHDMSREYRILSALHPVYGKVPKPVAFCEDSSVLGAPFYLMERVHGVVLRSRMPDDIELGSATMRQLSINFIDNLAAIHGIDVRAAGLGNLGKPEGYIQRQMDGWRRRYENAKTEEIPLLDQVASWLAANMPAPSGACLIHNDYKYDNVILRADDLTQVRAVLDWEMATLGDPLLDLGSTLGYWVEVTDPPEWRDLSFCLTTLDGNLTRVELADRYAGKTGLDIQSGLLWAYLYALFKIAVIIQQIYKRYRQGNTSDVRFASLGERVLATARTATRALERGAL